MKKISDIEFALNRVRFFVEGVVDFDAWDHVDTCVWTRVRARVWNRIIMAIELESCINR